MNNGKRINRVALVTEVELSPRERKRIITRAAERRAAKSPLVRQRYVEALAIALRRSLERRGRADDIS